MAAGNFGWRQGQHVVVGIAHLAGTSCQEQRGQGEECESCTVGYHAYLIHCFGTFRSFGCLIRIRLHGRSLTDSVKSFRWSVAMRIFSSVYAIFC